MPAKAGICVFAGHRKEEIPPVRECYADIGAEPAIGLYAPPEVAPEKLLNF